MGKAKTATSTEKEEEKAEQVRQKASARSQAKGNKGKWKTYAVYGIGGGVCLLAVFLAISPGPPTKKGGVTKWDNPVNDNGAISDVNARAEGNFTAASAPFFNRWTLGDARYGLGGISVSGMIGISGAVQVCDNDEGLEGGVTPPSYDARDNWPGCFGDVMDSGNCSASYAIAAAEVIAARFCIGDNEHFHSTRLSAQQILSCDKKSKGCNGGGVDSVWSYIQKRGLYPEECVPYAGEKSPACSKSMTTCDESKKLKVLDHCVLTQERAVKREIYNRGPVVAPMYLKTEYLTYAQGIYTPTENAETLFDANGEPVMHAVSLIGWGKSQGVPYWTIRHSWGAGWGENGYARVSIGSVVRDSYVVVGTAATPAAIEAAEQKKVEDEARKEELKKEREARDERIREQRAAREAEKASEQDDIDLKDLDDDDFEAEVDLDDNDPA